MGSIKKRKKLDSKERLKVEDLYRQGLGISAITKRINRPAQAVRREIKRTSSGLRIYGPYGITEFKNELIRGLICAAQDDSCFKKIKALLKKGWSPNRISGQLELQGLSINHEAICPWIWANKQHQGKLYRNLKRRGWTYRNQWHSIVIEDISAIECT